MRGDAGLADAAGIGARRMEKGAAGAAGAIDGFFLLDEETVDRAGRTGGTFLHSSRTNPGRVGKSSVPAHLKDRFTAEKNDLTPEVLKNLAWLGIDTLIPIGGDDTLSYGVRLHKEGFKVIGIPKTMDN